MDPSKRSFLKVIFCGVNGLLASLVGVPIVGYIVGPLLKKKEKFWAEAGTVADLKPGEPQAKRLRYDDKSGFRPAQKSRNVYIMTEGSEVIAYSTVCTHVGCNIVWKPEEKGGIFFCPCHGGEFSRKGDRIAGPPPRPLDRLTTKIEDGKIYVEV